MCSLFCRFSLFQDFYSDDAHHANYGKHSSNQHFRHGAHSVYKIYSVLKLFDFAVCSAHFDFFEITTPVMRIMLTMANIVQIIISDMAHTMYIRLQCFETFRFCSLLCTFWLFRNCYSGDAHHVNYGKHILNHHFRHGAHSVYKIYRVFKLFEITVCSTHFDFFEITTPVMRIMLTMANIVQIIISDMAHTVYIRFIVFWNFSILQFVLHILTFSKLLLRWCASF